MKNRLIAIIVAGFACSSHAPEHPRETTRLPVDLPAPSIARQAEGSIAGQDGRPVAGALVSVIDLGSYRGVGFAVSGRDGRFSVGLPSTPVVVTATANGHVAGVVVPTAGNRLAFALARPSEAARRFSGIVVDTKGRPLAQIRVRLMNWKWPIGATFYTSSDEAGRYQFSVDSAGPYDVMVDDPRYISDFSPLLHHDSDKGRLTAYDRGWIITEASRVDESALRDLCAPWTGDGVRQLASALRTARAVGLGEATHGTREFTGSRSRIIEELIRDGWLTTIALEASWEEATHLDEYVRRGKGTGRDAVKSLAYWPWRTEEFLAFVESVRKLNDGLPAHEKIEFRGIDYAPPGATADFMRRYFEELGHVPPTLLSGLEPLRRIVSWFERSKLSREERDKLLRTLKALEPIAESQSVISLPAIQGLRITQLILESSRDDDGFRDPVMADAVLALLARSDKERHIAIWAHNLHLAERPVEGAVPMGHYLKARLAEKYRAVGSMFYEGSFQTYGGQQGEMVNHDVVPPPPFYFESAVHRVSPPEGCFLDVTEATRRPRVRDWLSAPKHMRNYGGLEISESYPWPPVIIPDLWSMLVFVPRSTPTTPLD